MNLLTAYYAGQQNIYDEWTQLTYHYHLWQYIGGGEHWEFCGYA